MVVDFNHALSTTRFCDFASEFPFIVGSNRCPSDVGSLCIMFLFSWTLMLQAADPDPLSILIEHRVMGSVLQMVISSLLSEAAGLTSALSFQGILHSIRPPVGRVLLPIRRFLFIVHIRVA